MPTKILTLYNHKGGVSKTTTTFNLAHLIAEAGQKVLVVDADPQCNLTELMLANIIADLDEKTEETGEVQSLPGASILDLLKPRIDGDRGDIDLEDVDVVQISSNLSLLRGDVSLSDIEEALAESHIQRFSNKTHDKKTYVALGSFLRAFGNENGFDYIIIDVGPSSGALTRTCFLVCDGFFIPTVPDRFNVQAMSTLSSILDKWMKEHEDIYNSFRELKLPISLGKPFFLGIILQNYKLYGGSPRKGYQFWMDKIPVAFEEKLLPVLKKHSTAERDLTFGLDRGSCVATRIPDFASLAPLLQEAGKPVFAITPEDTKTINNGSPYTGSVWTQTEERIVRYKQDISNLWKTIQSIPE